VEGVKVSKRLATTPCVVVSSKVRLGGWEGLGWRPPTGLGGFGSWLAGLLLRSHAACRRSPFYTMSAARPNMPAPPCSVLHCTACSTVGPPPWRRLPSRRPWVTPKS
jgi:hypothetical protein